MCRSRPARGVMRLDLSSLSNPGGIDRERLQGLARYLPALFSALLVVAIAHSAATLTWRIIPLPDQAGSASPAPVTAAAPASDGSRVDVDSLIELAMFGEPDPADEPASVDLSDVEAPETQLNLSLRGVLATAEESVARAIIAAGDGDDKSYKVGDTIGSGAILRAVYPDRVILERSGELETLRLPRDNADSGLSRSAGRSNTVPVPSEVADLREEIRENPERITDIIRPTPHRENGEMVGFRIFPGRMREQFRQLGLRAGDIVTAVNGQQLNSPEAAMGLMNELQDAQQVELTIRRGGQQTTVTLSLARGR